MKTVRSRGGTIIEEKNRNQYHIDYRRKHYRVYQLKVRLSDEDIIAKLEEQKNITQYLKDLIRKDIG